MTKISDLNILATAKGNAYIPVVDPDETSPENQNKRIAISTLVTGGTDNTNFAPYDPDVFYRSDAPDFVSYNGNIYEYINATPAKANLPTNTTYWKLASSGKFTHTQNTDTYTNSRIFEIGKQIGIPLDTGGIPVSEPTGSVILAFVRKETEEGAKAAIRLYWEDYGAVQSLQQCLYYTGTGSDVWQVIGSDFTPIAENQYGTHPAFVTQADVNAYLLSGGAVAVAPVSSASATVVSDSEILLTWTNPV